MAGETATAALPRCRRPTSALRAVRNRRNPTFLVFSTEALFRKFLSAKRRYSGAADWSFIALAKATVSVPVVRTGPLVRDTQLKFK